MGAKSPKVRYLICMNPPKSLHCCHMAHALADYSKNAFQVRCVPPPQMPLVRGAYFRGDADPSRDLSSCYLLARQRPAESHQGRSISRALGPAVSSELPVLYMPYSLDRPPPPLVQMLLVSGADHRGDAGPPPPGDFLRLRGNPLHPQPQTLNHSPYTLGPTP